MPAQLIDGRAIAQSIRDDVKKKIAASGVIPGLAVVLVGPNPASHMYVELKERACQDVGIHFEKYLFTETEPQERVITRIQELNTRHDIHAILVQLPLPSGFDEDAVIRAMDHRKDVDGFHPANIAAVIQGGGRHPLPVLIKAIMRLIEETRVPLAGKSATILGNSDVFMKPLGAVLTRAGAAVDEILRSAQDDDALKKIKNADVLVVAVGKPWMITPAMVKQDAIVIDIGTTRDSATGQLRGDVHPDVAQVAGWLTPVPGGVGPVTVAMLLENTTLLAEHSHRA
ncbi:MAG: bifunctional 5,10-methylenetetrahydrofolate dehydrogenase/5,10-methenyltetrahydrofolate cyclohydrolase [Patescibacteria group bacterium]